MRISLDHRADEGMGRSGRVRGTVVFEKNTALIWFDSNWSGIRAPRSELMNLMCRAQTSGRMRSSNKIDWRQPWPIKNMKHYLFLILCSDSILHSSPESYRCVSNASIRDARDGTNTKVNTKKDTCTRQTQQNLVQLQVWYKGRKSSLCLYSHILHITTAHLRSTESGEGSQKRHATKKNNSLPLNNRSAHTHPAPARRHSSAPTPQHPHGPRNTLSSKSPPYRPLKAAYYYSRACHGGPTHHAATGFPGTLPAGRGESGEALRRVVGGGDPFALDA